MNVDENGSAEKHEIKDVYFDFPSVISKLKEKHGGKVTLSSIGNEINASRTTMSKWQNKAPDTFASLYFFLKENDLKFEDLIKPVVSHE